MTLVLCVLLVLCLTGVLLIPDGIDGGGVLARGTLWVVGAVLLAALVARLCGVWE